MNKEKTEKYLFNKYYLAGEVLNTGCGWGRNILLLEEQPLIAGVIHIDIDKFSIYKLINKYYHFDIRIMDCCDLKFMDESFNFYLALFNTFDYIYPLKERMEAWTEAYRVLKPNGKLIMSSHNIYNPRNFLRTLNFEREERYIHVPGGKDGSEYLYVSTPKNIIAEAKSVGFKLLEQTPKSKFENFHYYVFQKVL